MNNYKLFNDYWFDLAKRHVKNEITLTEVDLYNKGLIRKIYGSFEELLFDNIDYYSRIIRTIIWLYDNIIVQDGKVLYRNKDKVRYKRPMTATKFYYICMCQPTFSRTEIIYGYHQIAAKTGNTFYDLWPHLLNVGSFAFNVTYTTDRYSTKSYQLAFEQDVTSPKYLEKVIVNSSYVSVDKYMLSYDIGILSKIHELMISNYQIFKDFSKSGIVVDIRPVGMSYISSTFNEEIQYKLQRLTRTQCGNISDTIDFDVHFSQNAKFVFDKLDKCTNHIRQLGNLKLIAKSMIQNYRKKFKAIRTTIDGNGYAIIQIKKFWNNYRVIESFISNGQLIKKNVFNVGKIWKLVDYIVSNGYFIYTVNEIEKCVHLCSLDNQDAILTYYTEYINQTFLDADIRLQMMEKQTSDIIAFIDKK